LSLYDRILLFLWFIYRKKKMHNIAGVEEKKIPSEELALGQQEKWR
jgi:hypothetical protein